MEFCFEIKLKIKCECIKIFECEKWDELYIDKVNEHDDILFCYVGEDWYIKVNNAKKVEVYIMNNSNNIKEAQREVEQVRQVIEARLQVVNADTMKV